MLDTKKCFGCGVALDRDSNSRAHVIPNALGGRLAPKGIICRTCNTRLDELADNRLINVFAEWPTLLNIPRQDGSHPAVTVKDVAGNEYRVEADGSRTIAKPTYSKKAVADGHSIEIKAPTWKQAEQRINQATKEFPQLNSEEALANAQIVSEVPKNDWHIRMNIAPACAFPGVYTALWLFHVHHTGEAFCTWDDLISALQDASLDEKLRYMPDGFPGLEELSSPLSHVLVLKSVPSRKILVGYVEVLGTLKVGGVLVSNYESDIEFVYAANPFDPSNISSDCKVDGTKFGNVPWPNNGYEFGATNKSAILDGLKQAAKALQHEFNRREA